VATDGVQYTVQATVDRDRLQCGYGTLGEICRRMLDESATGAPSYDTDELAKDAELTDDAIRERMSDNLCRCGAYSNILAALRRHLDIEHIMTGVRVRPYCRYDQRRRAHREATGCPASRRGTNRVDHLKLGITAPHRRLSSTSPPCRWIRSTQG
jgi:hypothetical protein